MLLPILITKLFSHEDVLHSAAVVVRFLISP